MPLEVLTNALVCHDAAVARQRPSLPLLDSEPANFSFGRISVEAAGGCIGFVSLSLIS
jgi:hypothetical protein